MKKMFLLCCSLALMAALQAQIIHVPAAYPTIQQGINAATPGDTVLVAEGTYYEQINFKGKKPLVVASRFLMDADTSHISKTIIDGSQLTNKDSASVVYFFSGEDTTSILCGFTITGGRGTTTITPPEHWRVARQGGGIWISGSGAKISHNHITRNKCEDILLPGVVTNNGGGICTDLAFYDNWVVIESNLIDSNYVTTNKTNGLCSGAGMMIVNNCRIINNIIKNNVGKSLVNTDYWVQGVGALVFSMDTSYNTKAIIQNNLFLNNVNNSNKAFGGGMKVGDVQLTCKNNSFIGNRTESDISLTNCYGAGLEAGNFLKGSAISNNIFQENYSEKSDAGLMLFSSWINPEPVIVENNYFLNNVAKQMGGAFGTYDCHVLLQNNVFSGNRAGTNGGAIQLQRYFMSGVVHLATLINNSFFGNTAKYYGGAIVSTYSKPLIINSVFWGDSSLFGREIYLIDYDKVEIANSLINTSFITGTFIDSGSNLNTDPMFTDTVLLETETWSPCVDAGIASFTCSHGETIVAPAYDILGFKRPVGSGYDIGAFDLESLGVGFSEIKPTLPFAAWPNPFTSSVNFNYTVKESSLVTLRVFDSYGRLVAELVNAFQQNGEHKVNWNAESLPAGIYYCRLQAGEQVKSVKVLKMK